MNERTPRVRVRCVFIYEVAPRRVLAPSVLANIPAAPALAGNGIWRVAFCGQTAARVMFVTRSNRERVHLADGRVCKCEARFVIHSLGVSLPVRKRSCGRCE